MLKITVNETPVERRWIVQGRLVAVWVDELRKSWKNRPRSTPHSPCVIDLNDVTFIDKKGERLLRSMSEQGAQFVANGVYIRHVLEQVITHGKPHLSRLLSCVFAGFVATVICLHPARSKADPPNFYIANHAAKAFNTGQGIETRTISADGPRSKKLSAK